MKLYKLIFSRMGILASFVILQMAAIYLALVYFGDNYAYVQAVYTVITIVLAIYILRQRGASAYKFFWIILIALFPVFGSAMFILMGHNLIPAERRKQLVGSLFDFREENPYEKVDVDELRAISEDAAMQAEYLTNAAMAPLYKNSESEYLESGEIFFEKMLEDMEKAEEFIYLEFFIIGKGELWDRFLEILERKAAEGVDVRVIYDDIGTILRMSANYPKKLEKMGIKCGVFQRFMPIVTGTYMNRDHRKLCIVDGKVGYTGGANLADEYINLVTLYGHWYDSGIRVEGEAAYSFMLMFISMWNYIFKHDSSKMINEIPKVSLSEKERSDGYHIPFYDSPIDDEPTSMNSYINMIAKAKRYIYICSPYLALDESVLSAFSIAAKSGVDIRLIAPGVPDKRIVNMSTKSFYKPLLDAGVRIFEYTPGFMHSKTIVADDEYGICGSINFSYRSFYLNHESAVWLYKTKSVLQMRDEFLEVLEECTEITKEKNDATPYIVKLLRDIASILAPFI